MNDDFQAGHDEAQRDHDARNRQATRLLIDGLRDRIVKLEQDQDRGGTMELGWGAARAKGPWIAVVALVTFGMLCYGAVWALNRVDAQHKADFDAMVRAHVAIWRQTAGVREEMRIVGCVMTLTPAERATLRSFRDAPGGRVRSLMRPLCPWLDEDDVLNGHGDGSSFPDGGRRPS